MAVDRIEVAIYHLCYNETMRRLIFGLFIAVILGVVGYFVFIGKPSISDVPSSVPTTEVEQGQMGIIEIKNFSFSPNKQTAKPGEKITVTNRDIVGHTVTSDQDGLFDTGLIGRNESKTFSAPTTPGEYPYYCTPHPFMKAVLVVEE